MNNAGESTRLVTFRLGEHLFAAEIHAVQRVLRYEAPRALPDMPDWMEGVVDYQGTMVPVIDMRRRFGAGRMHARAAGATDGVHRSRWPRGDAGGCGAGREAGATRRT